MCEECKRIGGEHEEWCSIGRRWKLFNPGPVMPLERDLTPAPTQDARPIWLRLFRSIRPKAGLEINKKTGKPVGTFEVTAGTDF